MNADTRKNARHFELNAKAVAHLRQHFREQPTLEQIAAHFHLSPAHFQRLFRQWVGLTPKQFLQQLTASEASNLLRKQNNCLQTSHALGLSGGGRLYDHLVTLEAVTPGELRSQGKGLTFYFGEGDTPLGRAQVTWTNRGIHSLRFCFPQNTAATDQGKARALWQQAKWTPNHKQAQALLDNVFQQDAGRNKPISLWVQGTNFQVAVWRALLNIPNGELSSYGQLANNLGNANASRAVGTAVGSNPVAVLIPCHRVIRNNGNLGGYRWGLETKRWLLGKELGVHCN